MALEMAQYNASTNQVANAARLRYARLQKQNNYGDKYHINNPHGNANASLKEVDDEIKMIDRKNFLNKVRKINSSTVNKDISKKILNLVKNCKKRIKRHERPIWILNFLISIYLDFINPIISAIPWIGWFLGFILGFSGGIYINISLWRVGNIKTRTKRRFEKAILSFLDTFPYINFFPFTLISVVRAYENSKADSDEAKNILIRIQKKYPSLVVD